MEIRIFQYIAWGSSFSLQWVKLNFGQVQYKLISEDNLGNATVTKQSHPKARKEGDEEQIRTKLMPHMKAQMHKERRTAIEILPWNSQ